MADEKKPEKEEPGNEEGKKSKKRKVGPIGPGDPVKIHEDYVRRHLEGGAPATREAYERAREQWRKLPGAMVSEPRSGEPDIEHLEDDELTDDSKRGYGQEDPPNTSKGESSQGENPNDPKNESS